MNYTETLQYLYEKLPMFSRIGEAAIKKDLSNTIELCAFLGNPQHTLKTIHVAGTNGKGSVSHMLASVLQQAGYKTGLYTSPHLIDFRERIKINGNPCAEKFVVEFTKNIQPKIEEIQPSFFEITVAMAFDYFAKEHVDIAIIETGLGGRLDSTNIITPLLSIITNISWDHQHLLGNSLQEIAFEKAGIIKTNIPVLIGRRQTESTPVFLQKAAEIKAPLFFSDEVIPILKSVVSSKYLLVEAVVDNSIMDISCDLCAMYQVENIRTALAAIHVLQQRIPLKINARILQDGFSKVQNNTQLMGRWQVLQEHPKVVADVGHNEDGVRKILEQLAQESFTGLHIIIGVVKDKDIDSILSLLPKNAVYYFTEPQLPRKLEAIVLQEKAKKYFLNGYLVQHPKDALNTAISKAAQHDFILVMGSFFIVSEIL